MTTEREGDCDYHSFSTIITSRKEAYVIQSMHRNTLSKYSQRLVILLSIVAATMLIMDISQSTVISSDFILFPRHHDNDRGVLKLLTEPHEFQLKAYIRTA